MSALEALTLIIFAFICLRTIAALDQHLHRRRTEKKETPRG